MPELVRHVESPSVGNQSRYFIKRNFWSFLDRIFRVVTADGQMILYVKHPVLRLREEFTIWADETCTRPVFVLKSRQIIAINFCYDITDAATGQIIATIQKRGLRSLLRDTFHILGPSGEPLGTMEEQGHSILRRFFPILTSKHLITIEGQRVAFVRQLFRFFTRESQVDLEPSKMDPRFVLACALLAIMAEARRESGGNLLTSG